MMNTNTHRDITTAIARNFPSFTEGELKYMTNKAVNGYNSQREHTELPRKGWDKTSEDTKFTSFPRQVIDGIIPSVVHIHSCYGD